MAGPAHVRCLICLAAVALGRAEAPPVAAVDPLPPPAAPAPSPMLTKLFAGDPPKFAPPKPGASTADTVALGGAPRNGIIRLPKYIVREPRPIGQNDVMTPQAREDAIVKRYVGEPTGLDVALNSYTLNTLWEKIPGLGRISDFAAINYKERTVLDYSRIEARRKYIEALGVSADVPPTKATPDKDKKATPPDDK